MKLTPRLKRIASATLATLLVTAASLTAYSGIALAAVTNPTAAAKVSFTFDDGDQSAYTQAAPTLKKYGLTGTSYVTTGCVGMTTIPNKCRADSDVRYMTWTQIKALQNTYGWEIGSHTVTHPYLATKDATDGQPNLLTPTQVANELTQSKAALAAQGINATAFASPYGDYNPATLAAIAKVYQSHRGFADNANNIWPNNEYLLYNMPVQVGVTVAQVKSRIDQAIANNQWLIMTMHDIRVTPSTDPDDYQYKTADLDAIAAYVKAKQDAGLIKNVNITAGLTTGLASDNLMPNSTFDNGVADGWTTPNPGTITKNTGNNGSYPSATNSIRFAPNSGISRLFSPKVAVNPNNTYLFKNYVNVASRTNTGQLEFYIDEYDTAGNWISGQYKKAEGSVWAENLNFTYKPTSANVARASLQITLTAMAGITAYLDNVELYALTNTPPPVPTTVLQETLDAGIANGWSTDNPSAITADATTQSVRFQAGTTNAHLFAPLITVDTTRTYTISSYLNLQTLTSNEVAFYIDEYDAAGNWISGQYKTARTTTGSGTISLTYKPSSASVAKSSLQLIVPANSGASGYFDDVRWFYLP